MSEREQFVWTEKYRPKKIADCILPAGVASTIQGVLASGNMPNLLFSGTAGVGKTTVARALCDELGADTLVINASDENGINVLRDRIKDFASAMSFNGTTRKYVILDEADYLNAQSTQPALRAFLDESALNCGFIFCVNFRNRIIEPLQSRCSLVDFKIPSDERTAIAALFFQRAVNILDDEGITYNKKTVAEVVKQYFPDFRRVLNELQRYSMNKTLSPAILSQLSDTDIQQLFQTLKNKDFTGMRKWVAIHEDMDDAEFYRMLTEQVVTRAADASVPELIVMIADYNYRAAFAADKQLNHTACLVEVMHQGLFK